MGNLSAVLILICLLIPLWIQLRRDYLKGICYGVFLCVAMPTLLRVTVPGGLPQLTIYRIILGILFVFWLKNRPPGNSLSEVPLFRVFCFWAATNFISVMLTKADFVTSAKSYLDFVLELGVFYFLLVSSLRGRQDALQVLRAACAGVALVAVIACVERYTGFNPADYFTSTDQTGSEYRPRAGAITATYQHRILLGTGMAMGWPLALALSALAAREGFRRRWLPWCAAVTMIGACYFSNSRGPWLAAAMAGVVVLIGGGPVLRRRMSVLLLLMVLVLAFKPGIYDMLVHDYNATSDADSLKGGTFRYRLELWSVAWSQISLSPERFLFGYGPGCGMNSTLDWHLSYRGGQDWEIWSWDNHLAYDLYQSGLLGLTTSLLLYGGVLFAAYRYWRTVPAAEHPLTACILASLLAYCFMLTNVLMFVKPVNFLFWTTAAALFVLRRSAEAQIATEFANSEQVADVALFANTSDKPVTSSA